MKRRVVCRVTWPRSVSYCTAVTNQTIISRSYYISFSYIRLFINNCVLHMCKFKNGRNSVRYEWITLKSDNWKARLSESRFRFRMCGTLLEWNSFNPEADTPEILILLCQVSEVLQNTKQNSSCANASSMHSYCARSKVSRDTDCCKYFMIFTVSLQINSAVHNKLDHGYYFPLTLQVTLIHPVHLHCSECLLTSAKQWKCRHHNSFLALG